MWKIPLRKSREKQAKKEKGKRKKGKKSANPLKRAKPRKNIQTGEGNISTPENLSRNSKENTNQGQSGNGKNG